MDTALIVAIISGLIALISAVVTVWGTLFSTSRTIRFEEKREKARVEREISRHQEPLATAVYDLQSRIYNIVCKVFIQRFVSSDINRERSYAIENTTFLIAQYFCCVEILRRGVQSSGYGAHLVNHEAMLKQDMVSAAFGSDRYGASFMLFAGEQRAVGEALIKGDAADLECMGYREFLHVHREGGDDLLDAIRDSVKGLVLNEQEDVERLRAIHTLLISLLKHLDPDYVRFPREYRQALDC